MIWDITITYPLIGETQEVRNKMIDTIGAEAASGRSFVEGISLADMLQIAWRALVRVDETKLSYDAWVDSDPVPSVKSVSVDPIKPDPPGS